MVGVLTMEFLLALATLKLETDPPVGALSAANACIARTMRMEEEKTDFLMIFIGFLAMLYLFACRNSDPHFLRKDSIADWNLNWLLWRAKCDVDDSVTGTRQIRGCTM